MQSSYTDALNSIKIIHMLTQCGLSYWTQQQSKPTCHSSQWYKHIYQSTVLDNYEVLLLYLSTFQREILYFLLHYIYLTAGVTGYFLNILNWSDETIQQNMKYLKYTSNNIPVM